MVDYDGKKPGQIAAYLVDTRVDHRERVRAALPFIPMSPELREIISSNISNMPQEDAEKALQSCAEAVYRHGKAAEPLLGALEREIEDNTTDNDSSKTL